MTAPAKPPPPPYVALAICATIVVLAAIAALVALVLFAPPGTDLVKILGACGTGLALVAAQVANYLKTRGVANQVHELSNGLGDAKTRAAIADVVHPDLINPEAAGQLAADRARRDGNKES